jgi:hypothetical protein
MRALPRPDAVFRSASPSLHEAAPRRGKGLCSRRADCGTTRRFIQYRFDERLGVSRSFTIATIVDASLWMLTTAIALVFALNGKIQHHRQWMTRSYAVAIVFLESRVIAGLGGWENPVNGETIWYAWPSRSYSPT